MHVVRNRTMIQIIASAKDAGNANAMEVIEPLFGILNDKSAKIRALTKDKAGLERVLLDQRQHIGELKDALDNALDNERANAERIEGLSYNNLRLQLELRQVHANIARGVYTTPASGYHVVASCPKGGYVKTPCTSNLSLGAAVTAMQSFVRSGCDDCEFFIEPF